MTMRQIVITVERDGTTKVDAQGFKGKGCQDATQAIEIAIGGTDTSNRSSTKKPDFFGEHSSTGSVRN